MFVVLLNGGKLLVVKKNWIEYPIIHSITKIFFSPYEDSEADFSLPTMQIFSIDDTCCYLGLVCKHFSKCYIHFTYDISYIELQIKYTLHNAETQHEAAMFIESKQRPAITTCLFDSPQLDPVLESGYVSTNSQITEFPSTSNCTETLDSNIAVTYAEVSVQK